MTKKSRVLVYGTGQIAKMVVSIIDLDEDVSIVGFLGDDKSLWGEQFIRRQVYGGLQFLASPTVRFDEVIVALGRVAARRKVGLQIRVLGIPQRNAIHPTAMVSQDVDLGEGNIIGAGVNLYVNPVIGNNVFIGPGVIVSHDSSVGDYALLSAGSVIGARVDVEEGAFIGAGATIMPPGWGKGARLRVGADCIVGVGAVVIRDVAPKSVVAGVPAKLLRYREEKDD